ncbi:UNVERIFIED_CONTAM: hypothetical protein Slati_3961200 [Sesamum latifolium]|uniref:Uncharacterized protein n=1 Tax=Sesamum latifolium TaxID=2727402 RepID=A0AAW2TQG7_9LAMI
MAAAKAVATPFPQGLKLSSEQGASLREPDKFQRLIGRLLTWGSLALIYHSQSNN